MAIRWGGLGRLRAGLFGSSRCLTTAFSFQSDPPRTAPGPTSSGKKAAVEKLWQEFFQDPSQWWDHRMGKQNARYPDFKHKHSCGALWLNGKWKPPWVEAELATMIPGSAQVNVFAWNRRLVRFLKGGRYEKTVELFHKMQEQGVRPDRFTFVPVLNACAGLRAIEEGQRTHAEIVRNGFESDVYVGSSLIGMYAKCGRADDALKVFNKMPVRSIVTWNMIILGLVKSGQAAKALELFGQVQQQKGLEPESFTFVAGLHACATLGALKEGREIHENIIRRGFDFDPLVCCSLIDMYAKCWRIGDAESVFNRIAHKDAVSYSAMIRGYVRCGQGQQALELHRRMQLEGVRPLPFVFGALLSACASIKSIEEGRRLHEWVKQSGLDSDLYVGSSLVDMYAKCGCIEDAWRVFNQMPSRDSVTWGTMIHGFVKSGQGRRALEVFRQMEASGVEPSPITFVGICNACANVKALEEGQRVHREVIRKALETNVFVGSSLIDMYVKCGSVDNARGVFNVMDVRDSVTWNAMILGYAKCKQGQESLKLFQQMIQEGTKPDSLTFVGLLNACASLESLEEGRRIHELILENGYEADLFVGSSLIDMYAKCGSIEDARRLFRRMRTRNVVSWNTMIMGLVKCGLGREALELFAQMEMEGVELDPVTFVGVLKACANLLSLEEGRHVHEHIIEAGFDSDIFVCNSLVDMYARCGSLEEALTVFHRMPSRSMVSWNSVLSGYAIHGLANEAVRHFEWMSQEGVEMDTVTFASLLSVCGHAGLVEEGLHYLQSMSPLYGISTKVEHYTCAVELLGRCGRLHEAEELIVTMPCDPDAVVWRTLLGWCRVHGNVEIGQRIARRVLALDPRGASRYAWQSNPHGGSNTQLDGIAMVGRPSRGVAHTVKSLSREATVAVSVAA